MDARLSGKVGLGTSLMHCLDVVITVVEVRLLLLISRSKVQSDHVASSRVL